MDYISQFVRRYISMARIWVRHTVNFTPKRLEISVSWWMLGPQTCQTSAVAFLWQHQGRLSQDPGCGYPRWTDCQKDPLGDGSKQNLLILLSQIITPFLWGNKHLLTSYLRLFKGIWLITIIPGHGTSHDQSAWLAPFTRFAGPGPKGLPERRIAAIITTGWWLSHPSEKYESQLGWWHSNIWKNVPNHQPDDGMMNIW
jgi:hypothetical protein